MADKIAVVVPRVTPTSDRICLVQVYETLMSGSTKNVASK